MTWIHNWEKNGWRTANKKEVLNKDLWQRLLELTNGKNIEWNHVGGHVGIPGNDRCDEIATAFASEKKIELYDGNAQGYEIDLEKIEAQAGSAEKKSSKKAHSNAKAYSYLSMVDGKIMQHATWAECEKRVKGVKKAKFKKALSKEEESEIIKSWKSNV